MRILICGAGGNLGGLLSQHLLAKGYELNLMWHRHRPPRQLADHPGVFLTQADLGDPASLSPALQGADVAVHLAGMLFAPRPAKFLAETNIGYMENLVRAAARSDVARLVFVSFPQVEGPSTPAHPAMGGLDGRPVSVHAQTRLAAERQLFSMTEGTRVEPVVVRSGVVYGPGVKLIEAARWLLAKRLMAIWPSPTWYHFIALADFLRGLEAAVFRPGLHGIYPLGDDCPLPLQTFLDRLADHWGFRRPWRLPPWAFGTAAAWVELAALVLRTPAPLTRDILALAHVDHAMDTSRMKTELLPELEVPRLEDGLRAL